MCFCVVVVYAFHISNTNLVFEMHPYMFVTVGRIRPSIEHLEDRMLSFSAIALLAFVT